MKCLNFHSKALANQNPKPGSFSAHKALWNIRHYDAPKLFTKFLETFMNIIESQVFDQKCMH